MSNDLPRLFAGRRCFILGGGSSLTSEVCDRSRGMHAIAINSTALVAPWAEVLYFGDSGWARDHRGLLAAWEGRCIVTGSATAARRIPGVRHLAAEPDAPTSGHRAIDLAAAMGAVEIILLGFDCRTIAGRSHCHNDYPCAWTDQLYRDRVLPTWTGWRERMAARGVRVLNATRRSAITEFPAP